MKLQKIVERMSGKGHGGIGVGIWLWYKEMGISADMSIGIDIWALM